MGKTYQGRVVVIGLELALWQKITGVFHELSRNFDDAASHENGSVSLPPKK